MADKLYTAPAQPMALSRQKIKNLREALKLTQEAAGKLYGFKSLEKQHWFALETSSRGDPGLGTVERMCTVLQCSILDILADDSPAMPKALRPRVGRRIK